MQRRTTIALLLASIASLTFLACGGRDGSAGSDQPIRSTPSSSGLTVTLASKTGQVKSGGDDVILIFSDASGKPVDVGAASLVFHMPGMGSMPEMNDSASLTTTNTPGRYRAQVKIEMAGTWEARISYQGAKGTGQVTMSVNVK